MIQTDLYFKNIILAAVYNYGFAFPRNFIKCSHRKYSLLCLASFTQHVFQIYAYCCVNFFLLCLDCVLFYVYVIFCLSIRQLMGIWSISHLGLIWIILLRIPTYKLLCEYIFSFLLSICLWKGMFHFLRNCQTVFQSSCIILDNNGDESSYYVTSLPIFIACLVK